MRILHILSHLDPGGIAIYVYNLCRALRRKGVEVGVASQGGKLIRDLKEEGIRCFSLPLRVKNEFHPKLFKSLFLLENIRRKFPFEIIHAHSRSCQVLSSIYMRLHRVRYVSTCHGYFRARLSRRLFKCWGEKVVAISPQVRDHLIYDLKVCPSGVELIPTGVDIPLLKKKSLEVDFRKEFGIGERYFIGSLGRLSDVKRYDLLLKAFHLFNKDVPSSFLGIMGSGLQEEYLQTLARKLGLKNNFRIFPDLYKESFLRSLDIFCLSSRSEGLGLSVLEAMALSRAVVVSCRGGLNFIVQDHLNGILVKQDDPQGFFQAFVELYSNKKLFERISQNAQQRVEEDFSLDKMVEKIYSLYEGLLK